jgi:hypothetical protein
MVPLAAYAGGDDDDKDGDDKGDRKYVAKDGDGNKQKVEDESAGAIADCDENEVDGEDAFDCIAAAASDNEGDFGVGDGVDDGRVIAPGNVTDAECPPGTIRISLDPLLCLVVGVGEDNNG